MADIDKPKQDKTKKELKELIHDLLNFDELYSYWLASNLHRLKESSLKLLETLDPESYQYVYLSIVSRFDLEKEMGLFKSRARTIFKGFGKEKRIMITPKLQRFNLFMFYVCV